MRVELKKLLEKLGVDRVLEPYETRPWAHYDAARGLTCGAEVRMGPGGDDLEAEIQFMYDEGREPPPEPVKKEETDGKAGESSSGGGRTFSGGPIQILKMRALPHESMWSPKELLVKGKNMANSVHDWEGKSCEVFRACVESLQMGIIPDMEELIERELEDDDMWGGGGRGKIGRKSPKIKPAALLGMKPGGGFKP